MNIYFKILVLSITLYSCQNKDEVVSTAIVEKENKVEKEVILTKKQLDDSRSNIKVIYYPEKFETTETDTTLQEGILIKISKSPIMNSSVVKSYEENDTTIKYTYRDIAVLLEIEGLSKKKVSKRFTKQSFFVDVKEFYSISTLTNLWFDSFDSKSKIVKLHCTMCEPDTDYCYFYSIYVNQKGEIKIELEEIT